MEIRRILALVGCLLWVAGVAVADAPESGTGVEDLPVAVRVEATPSPLPTRAGKRVPLLTGLPEGVSFLPLEGLDVTSMKMLDDGTMVVAGWNRDGGVAMCLDMDGEVRWKVNDGLMAGSRMLDVSGQLPDGRVLLSASWAMEGPPYERFVLLSVGTAGDVRREEAMQAAADTFSEARTVCLLRDGFTMRTRVDAEHDMVMYGWDYEEHWRFGIEDADRHIWLFAEQIADEVLVRGMSYNPGQNEELIEFYWLDPEGEVLRSYIERENGRTETIEVEPMADGGLIMHSTQVPDNLLTRISPAGEREWVRVYEDTSFNRIAVLDDGFLLNDYTGEHANRLTWLDATGEVVRHGEIFSVGGREANLLPSFDRGPDGKLYMAGTLVTRREEGGAERVMREGIVFGVVK